MIAVCIVLLASLSIALAQDEFFPEKAVIGKDSTLANALVDAAQSVIAFVRCGRLGCPKEQAMPFIRVTDNGVASPIDSDDEADVALMCRVTTYRVTKKRNGVTGRTAIYEADIFGQSTTGRFYLVHTLDLSYLSSTGVDAFADVEKEFPYGSETPCLPEILRSNK